jgi:AraC-like DNA-binding protein
MNSTHGLKACSGDGTDSPFELQCQHFIALSQVLAIAIAERSRSPREAAACLVEVLPAVHSSAEFLLLRSVLAEFSVRALLVTAPSQVGCVAPLLTVRPPAGDLAETFMKCLSVTDGRLPLRAAGSIQEARTRRAVAVISARCCEPGLSAESVASAVGVSEQYLAKLLRFHHGCGFRTVLRQARISIACTRLERSFSSVKEIAAAVGYSSTSQFDRDFRRECQRTPGEYRRGLLGQAELP